jgi:hypothetical protein
MRARMPFIQLAAAAVTAGTFSLAHAESNLPGAFVAIGEASRRQTPTPGKAILYEEGGEPQGGASFEGAVIWRTQLVRGDQGQPPETALSGEVSIPARNLKMTLLIRRNTDTTLPASHTIEVRFSVPQNFNNAGIANVPGLIMKTEEQSQGAALAGLSVRVTGGYFLIGLSSLDSEKAANEQLLRDRAWIDIPIRYDNNRRAVLTLEKGTSGEKAFNDVLATPRVSSIGAEHPAEATMGLLEAQRSALLKMTTVTVKSDTSIETLLREQGASPAEAHAIAIAFGSQNSYGLAQVRAGQRVQIMSRAAESVGSHLRPVRVSVFAGSGGHIGSVALSETGGYVVVADLGENSDRTSEQEQAPVPPDRIGEAPMDPRLQH